MKNMGKCDRAIRLLLAAGIVVLYFTKIVTGALGIALLVVAAVLALTGMVRLCLLYLPFGIRTNGNDKSGNDKSSCCT
jgi:hypothetical protein